MGYHSASIKGASFQAICVQDLPYFSGSLSVTLLPCSHKEMKMEGRRYNLKCLWKSPTVAILLRRDVLPAPIILGNWVLTLTIFATLMVSPNSPTHPNH